MLKETLEIWFLKKMQKISWTERRTNEDVLKIIEGKGTLIDNLKRLRERYDR